MKKLLLLGVLGIMQWSPGSGQDTTQFLSLKQCLKIGLESGQSVINARFEKDRVGFQRKETLSKGLPQLEGYGTFDDYVQLPVLMIPGEIFNQPGTTIPVKFGTKYNLEGGFRATQLLYNQTFMVAVKLSGKYKEMSDLNYTKVCEDAVYDISKLYFLTLITIEQKHIVSNNIEYLKRLLKITESQLKTGFVRTVDFDRVKVNVENLNTELDNLTILLEQQLELLKYSIGIKKSGNIVLTDSLNIALISIEAIPDSSGNKRTELAILEKQKELSLINKKLISAGYYPTLSAYGQYYYQGQRDQFDFFEPGGNKWANVGVVGLSLNVPIFDGFEKKAKVAQAKIDYQLAQNNYDFTSRYLNIEYTNAVKKYQNAKKAIQNQQMNSRLAEKVYEQSLLQYQQGIASLSDVLNSETSLSEARSNLINAMLQLRTAELDMLKASGSLKTMIN